MPLGVRVFGSRSLEERLVMWHPRDFNRSIGGRSVTLTLGGRTVKRKPSARPTAGAGVGVEGSLAQTRLGNAVRGRIE